MLSKVKGVRLAGQGFRFYDNRILKRKDHRGRNYFWIGGFYKGYCRKCETDCMAVDKGYAALTPMKIDSTDVDFMATMGGLAHAVGERIKP